MSFAFESKSIPPSVIQIKSLQEFLAFGEFSIASLDSCKPLSQFVPDSVFSEGTFFSTQFCSTEALDESIFFQSRLVVNLSPKVVKEKLTSLNCEIATNPAML